MRNMRTSENSLLMGVLPNKIRQAKFKSYCDYFSLEYEQAKKDLTKRGYHIMSI